MAQADFYCGRKSRGLRWRFLHLGYSGILILIKRSSRRTFYGHVFGVCLCVAHFFFILFLGFFFLFRDGHFLQETSAGVALCRTQKQPRSGVNRPTRMWNVEPPGLLPIQNATFKALLFRCQLFFTRRDFEIPTGGGEGVLYNPVTRVHSSTMLL